MPRWIESHPSGLFILAEKRNLLIRSSWLWGCSMPLIKYKLLNLTDEIVNSRD